MINLGNNGMSAAGAKDLVAALQVNPALQVLDLGGPRISVPGTTDLTETSKVNPTLQMLNLDH